MLCHQAHRVCLRLDLESTHAATAISCHPGEWSRERARMLSTTPLQTRMMGWHLRTVPAHHLGLHDGERLRMLTHPLLWWGCRWLCHLQTYWWPCCHNSKIPWSLLAQQKSPVASPHPAGGGVGPGCSHRWVLLLLLVFWGSQILQAPETWRPQLSAAASTAKPLKNRFPCPQSWQGCETSLVTGLNRGLHPKFPHHPHYMFLLTG